jgi:hypothetical protein
MKKAILFLSPVLMLLLLDSCQALHRDIPKADAHYKRRVLTASDEEKEQPVARPAASASLREDRLEEQIAAEPKAVESIHRVFPGTEKEMAAPGTAIERQIVVPQMTAVLQDDTLTGDEEPEEIDEAVLEEAYESERVARSAYRFSFLPAFSLIFFPLLLIGVIGTLVQLARFRRYQYVTEAGLDYEERAKRTLVITVVVPILLTVLLILLILALL